jgi:hypothetical protein
VFDLSKSNSLWTVTIYKSWLYADVLAHFPEIIIHSFSSISLLELCSLYNPSEDCSIIKKIILVPTKCKQSIIFPQNSKQQKNIFFLNISLLALYLFLMWHKGVWLMLSIWTVKARILHLIEFVSRATIQDTRKKWHYIYVGVFHFYLGFSFIKGWQSNGNSATLTWAKLLYYRSVV